MTPQVMAAADVLGGYRDALASVNTLVDASTVACSDAELVELARLNEELSRRVEALTVARFADTLERRPRPMISSAGSVSNWYEQQLNVGRGELQRRRKHAAKLAYTQSPTGQSIAPVLADTAEALRNGEISRTHVDTIINTMRQVPASVDEDTRASAEAAMAEYATQQTPLNLERLGTRILAYLDPDGPNNGDSDRDRRRKLQLSPQDQQLMSRLTADLSPAGRAVFELALELYAAKGFNNPDDPDSPSGPSNAPGLDPRLLAEAAKRDRRGYRAAPP